MANYKLLLGDCIEKLKELPDNSVDSIVTDPPYHLTSIVKRFGKENSAPAQFGTDGAFQRASKGFMGKEWDGGDIAFRQELWAECYRVLKPGGHLLSAGGTRTYHRMTCAIEDSGFEIRDSIQWWHYGSGFPKSHNISKALDKRGGNNDLSSEVAEKLKEARKSRGITKTEADDMFCGGTTNYMWFEGRKDGVRLPDDISFEKICKEWEELKPYQDKIKSANREVVGQYETDMGGLGGERLGNSGGDITLSATDVAKQWDGWGTALKPASEPFVNASKGEASIEIDADFHYVAKASKKDRDEGLDEFEEKSQRESSGGSRDFNARCANCGKKFIGPPENICSCDNPITNNMVFKKKNNHPTVKPTKLMEYLITLVTPKGGTVLDPFMGSGSTGKAAMNLGFNFIGIEKEEEYMKIAEARISEAKKNNSNI